MARLPVTGRDEGVWGDVLNDFLIISHTPSGTLKIGVVGDDQVTSLSQSKVAGLTVALADKADRAGAVFSQGATIIDPLVTSLIIWQAPIACRVTKISAQRLGGSGVTINVRKNSTQTLLAFDHSISTVGSWLSGAGLQNTSVAVGDSLEIMITAVSGTPSQLAVQIDFVTV